LILLQRKVLKTGNSLSVVLPSTIVSGNSPLCVELVEPGVVVYSPSCSTNYITYTARVKPRVQARYGEKKYYSLAIPKKIARKLRINRGDIVYVVVNGDVIAVIRSEHDLLEYLKRALTTAS